MYLEFNWLEYSVLKDALYCFTCRHFGAGLLQKGQSHGKTAFVSYGVKNWQNIKPVLTKHSVSEKHKTTFFKWNRYLSIHNELSRNDSVANLVNVQRKTEVIENRKHIIFLLKATLFLCKQGLAFRGHNETLESTNRGNFVEIVDTFADDNLKLNLNRRYGHHRLIIKMILFLLLHRAYEKILCQVCQI